jgi:hypothetical protein
MVTSSLGNSAFEDGNLAMTVMDGIPVIKEESIVFDDILGGSSEQRGIYSDGDSDFDLTKELEMR